MTIVVTMVVAAALAMALAAGCARPVYQVRSDAAEDRIAGGIERLKEAYFDVMDETGDSLVLNTLTVIDYNRAGNITLTDIFKSPDSVHVSRDEYRYDPSGRLLLEAVRRDPQRHTVATTVYTHDEAGRTVSERDESFGWRVDLGYDRKGYLRTRVDTTNMDDPVKVRYRYDRLGRLRTVKTVRGGGPTKRYTYHGDTATPATISSGKTEFDRYDERGNLVVSTVNVIKGRNKRGRINRVLPVTFTAEYEYDARGNWIRRTQLWDGRVVGVALRETGYYEGGEE